LLEGVVGGQGAVVGEWEVEFLEFEVAAWGEVPASGPGVITGEEGGGEVGR
jgi:hypothetical protein